MMQSRWIPKDLSFSGLPFGIVITTSPSFRRLLFPGCVDDSTHADKLLGLPPDELHDNRQACVILALHHFSLDLLTQQ